MKTLYETDRQTFELEMERLIVGPSTGLRETSVRALWEGRPLSGASLTQIRLEENRKNSALGPLDKLSCNRPWMPIVL
jgi:hypothetical protein